MIANVLRIFVSSPGDVGEERVMAERVVRRLQGTFGRSVQLEPIVWEHEPMRATSHPNDQLPRPSECDIVVCILWSRLGIRLPNGISAEGKTGTEWEFEDAATSYRQKQAPDLLVYRKSRDPVSSLREEETAYEEKRAQLKALDAFLKRWFESDDGTFKAVFKTFDTLDGFENLLEVDLRKVILERLKKLPDPERTWHQEPFLGLRHFDYEHAPIFFGRTRAIGAVKERLVQQAQRGCAFVLVFGMSGVGKSSLIRAGVLPTITQPGVIEGIGLWRWCVFRPSETPSGGDWADGLAAALTATTALPELADAGVSVADLALHLREAPDLAAPLLRVGLSRAAEATAAAEKLRRRPETRLALVVDQLEELFTLDGLEQGQRVAFVEALSGLARSGLVWVLATMRSDFYARCAEIPRLTAMKEGVGQLDLLPPTAGELQQIISYPAQVAGLRFEQKKTGEQLDHVLQEAALRDPQALPLLEFTLAELYASCCDQDNGKLTFTAYEMLGGMEGALAQYADERLGKLPAEVQAALPAVCRALATVRHEEEEVVVVQAAPRAAFQANREQNALVEAFISARLLVTDKAMVRLAHEALLRHWPALQKCLDEDRDFLRIRARVKEAATRWRCEEPRLPELLLPAGKPLTEGEFLLTRRQEIDPPVVDFIEASRQKRKMMQRRRRWVALAFVFLMVTGTVISSVLALLANQKANAEAEARGRARKNALLVSEQAEASLRAAQTEQEVAGETLRSFPLRVARHWNAIVYEAKILDLVTESYRLHELMMTEQAVWDTFRNKTIESVLVSLKEVELHSLILYTERWNLLGVLREDPMIVAKIANIKVDMAHARLEQARLSEILIASSGVTAKENQINWKESVASLQLAIEKRVQARRLAIVHHLEKEHYRCGIERLEQSRSNSQRVFDRVRKIAMIETHRLVRVAENACHIFLTSIELELSQNRLKLEEICRQNPSAISVSLERELTEAYSRAEEAARLSGQSIPTRTFEARLDSEWIGDLLTLLGSIFLSGPFSPEARKDIANILQTMSAHEGESLGDTLNTLLTRTTNVVEIPMTTDDEKMLTKLTSGWQDGRKKLFFAATRWKEMTSKERKSYYETAVRLKNPMYQFQTQLLPKENNRSPQQNDR